MCGDVSFIRKIQHIFRWRKIKIAVSLSIEAIPLF